MKLNVFGSVLGLLIVSVYTQAQQASSSAELSCRSQAKEIAVQTYQSCITSARQQKIDEIRKEYQAKLTELKSHYDAELKKIAPGNAHGKVAGGTNSSPTIKLHKVSSKSKKTKEQNIDVNSQSVVQTLPKKKIQNVQTLPVQNIQESASNASPENTSSSASSEETFSSDESINIVDPETQSE